MIEELLVQISIQHTKRSARARARALFQALTGPGWDIYKRQPALECIMWAPTRRDVRTGIESEIAVNGGRWCDFVVVRTKGLRKKSQLKRKGRRPCLPTRRSTRRFPT